ncbi:MAG: AAA family ATPase [Lachnospiraceae bacterium]|nr:AAA family ATPase [Lachnospiraceae bacterium]
MNRIRLPIGNDSFRKMREDEAYYIDKTAIIEELLNERGEVYLFTRPRRFGKTLTMSMLQEFFDISEDSKAIFEGTQIAKNTELCQKYMNQYPVLFLTLKHAEGLNFESAFERLKILISDWCISHEYLIDSPNISQENKELFYRLISKAVTEEEVINSLYYLSSLLKNHYGKKVIILIDEYDVPLAQANENNYYREMMDVIRVFMGKAFKTNPYLKFAVITGCLRIAKESIFTGLNNFSSNSISSEQYSQYFGFTENEVLELLRKTELEKYARRIKKWYNGYCFGKTEIYCPWDVLNYVRDLQYSPNAFPENYWKNTSHNGIIRSFIDRTDFDIYAKFETLLSGGYICEKVIEDLTYDVLHCSEDNLWSILYLTGYLTKAIPEVRDMEKAKQKDMQFSENQIQLIEEKVVLEDDTNNIKEQQILEEEIENIERKTYLRIPNEEVKTIFAETIATWFTDNVKKLDRKPIFDAFWSGNEQEVSDFVTDLLFETISYYDYREDYYHAFLAGIFVGAGYGVESNKEYGLGRPDIVVKDRKQRQVLLMEVKHSKNENEMETDAKTALQQIDVKQYARQFLKGFRNVVCYGVAFCEKECIARKIE